MSDNTTRLALRARVVLPVSSPPIDGGIITIQGDTIVAVGENTSLTPPHDLGDVALLPGLINAHTHLEFSELPSPLGRPGMPLPDWIDEVVQWRREITARDEALLTSTGQSRALRDGALQCLRGGATTVADIATCNVTTDLMPSEAPCIISLRELIGLTDSRVAEQLANARNYLACGQQGTPPLLRGLSPHAPYTAAPELVRQVAQLSQERDLVVAMHLAESPEELRLLAHGDGPFRNLLQRFSVWNKSTFPGGRRPHDYLQLLTAAHRSLIVHGNFLDREDWSLLARHRNRMSVVYCPRTHYYFRHPRYPLEAMLRAGVRVVFGTDSRASNPNLDLLQELQFAASRHANLNPQELLRMATLHAAESLGRAKRAGSLETGKSADMTVVQLREMPAHPRDLCAAILEESSKVCHIWVGGDSRGPAAVV